MHRGRVGTRRRCIRACVRGVAILLEIAVKKRHGAEEISFDRRNGYPTDRKLDPRMLVRRGVFVKIGPSEKRIIGWGDDRE